MVSINWLCSRVLSAWVMTPFRYFRDGVTWTTNSSGIMRLGVNMREQRRNAAIIIPKAKSRPILMC